MQRRSDYHVQQETIFVSQQRGIEHPALQSDPAENSLIQQGRYTDCVDELILKVINCPIVYMTA